MNNAADRENHPRRGKKKKSPPYQSREKRASGIKNPPLPNFSLYIFIPRIKGSSINQDQGMKRAGMKVACKLAHSFASFLYPATWISRFFFFFSSRRKEEENKRWKSMGALTWFISPHAGWNLNYWYCVSMLPIYIHLFFRIIFCTSRFFLLLLDAWDFYHANCLRWMGLGILPLEFIVILVWE